ncbi:MAG TPA: hypothetical protein VF666_21810 [Pyrinomonadaceae bacterium]
MIKLNKKFRVLSLALCIVVLGGAAAFAQRHLAVVGNQGRPEVKVMLAGAVERGSELVTLDKANAVRPGEVLQWNITSLNEGTGAAREYKAVGHIPKGTTFIPSTAVGENGSSVTYSIDGGKTFSTLPIIEEKQADGSVKQVPAPVSMYTEVRYEWKDALAAGGKLSASYKVRVK